MTSRSPWPRTQLTAPGSTGAASNRRRSPKLTDANGRSQAKLRLVVAVVAHGIGAVSIQIGQAGVEVNSQLAAKTVLQLSERFRARRRRAIPDAVLLSYARIDEHLGNGAMQGIDVALVEPQKIPDGYLQHPSQGPRRRT
jgi:hypothetical protein